MAAPEPMHAVNGKPEAAPTVERGAQQGVDRCTRDSDCVVSTSAGCCACCPCSAPYAETRAAAAARRGLCARVDCAPCAPRTEQCGPCAAPELLRRMRAVCRQRACVIAPPPVAGRS